MTVKVISEGPVKTYKVTCDRCHYRLQYTPEDIRTKQVSCMGDTDTEAYIVCPRDHREVSVPRSRCLNWP